LTKESQTENRRFIFSARRYAQIAWFSHSEGNPIEIKGNLRVGLNKLGKPLLPSLIVRHDVADVSQHGRQPEHTVVRNRLWFGPLRDFVRYPGLHAEHAIPDSVWR